MKKRYAGVAAMMLALCAGGGGAAWAGLGISLTGESTWALGNVSPGSSHASGTDTWGVRNTGDAAEDITIMVDGANVHPGAGAGANTFVLQHDVPGEWSSPITTDGIPLKANLARESTQSFDLRLTAPESTATTGEQTFTVTLTAAYYYGLPFPSVQDISPNFGRAGETASITNLAGENFIPDAQVKLTRSGQPDIEATDEAVLNGGTKITANIPLVGVAPGPDWRIKVTNPDAKISADQYQGTDCFFGVAPNDADTWTTDAGDIRSGKKAGSSGLQTLSGTYQPANVADVKKGVTYGKGGTEFTGTMETTLSWGNHTESECASAGGSVYTTPDEKRLCKFSGSNVSCPSGWLQAGSWQTYSTSAWGGDACGNYQSTGPTAFSDSQAVCRGTTTCSGAFWCSAAGCCTNCSGSWLQCISNCPGGGSSGRAQCCSYGVTSYNCPTSRTEIGCR